MRIKEEYKVREMAGEHIVVMQGRYGVDMTKVIALNETSLWLWNRLQGREFGTDDVRDLLLGEYDVYGCRNPGSIYAPRLSPAPYSGTKVRRMPLLLPRNSRRPAASTRTYICAALRSFFD